MNEYATNAKDRESIPKRLLFPTIVAALVASYVIESLKDHFGILKSYSWVLDVSSAPFFYDALRTWFDKKLWRGRFFGRRISEIPDLNGTWVGTGRSSYHPTGDVETTDFRVVARINQTWSRICIDLETKGSVSTSTMAVMNTEDSPERGLSYEYINKPRYFEDQVITPATMQVHQGVAHLQLGGNGRTLIGEYYTDPRRKNFGALKLTFHSLGHLSHEEVMELLRRPLAPAGTAPNESAHEASGSK